jgi:hypothetical protein
MRDHALASAGRIILLDMVNLTCAKDAGATRAPVTPPRQRPSRRATRYKAGTENSARAIALRITEIFRVGLPPLAAIGHAT